MMTSSDPISNSAHIQDLDSSLTSSYEDYFSFSAYLHDTPLEVHAESGPDHIVTSEEAFFLSYVNVEQELSDNYLNLQHACNATTLNQLALAQAPALSASPVPPPDLYDITFPTYSQYANSTIYPTFSDHLPSLNQDPLAMRTYTPEGALRDAPDAFPADCPSLYPDAEATPTCITPALITAPSTSAATHPTAAPSELHPHPRRRRAPLFAPYPAPSPERPCAADDLIVCKPRNVRVPPSARKSSSSASSTKAPASTPRDSLKCPYCPYVQRNRRRPDLTRHIASHLDPQWVCCGVPIFEAAERGVSEKVLEEGKLWQFDGMFMIGGCRKAFTRRDAYIRHLKHKPGLCFGDPHGLHQPGNTQNASVEA